MDKTILIIGSNSELAERTIEELKEKNYKIYATSRRIGVMEKHVQELHLDITSEYDFQVLKDKLRGVKFDLIINFTGIAVASAVEELNEMDLKRQLEINLFGLLRIIKYLCPLLDKKGKLMNVSSMASYGIFPFLSPYCISKAAADILLNLYSIESDIKTVSIRPGAVATKFWETSIEQNKQSLNSEAEKFKQEKEFLVENANKNSLHATNPIYVAKKIAQIIETKNPKSVYNIGLDSKFAKFTRFLPLDLVNTIVKFALKRRVNKVLKNGK